MILTEKTFWKIKLRIYWLINLFLKYVLIFLLQMFFSITFLILIINKIFLKRFIKLQIIFILQAIFFIYKIKTSIAFNNILILCLNWSRSYLLNKLSLSTYWHCLLFQTWYCLLYFDILIIFIKWSLCSVNRWNLYWKIIFWLFKLIYFIIIYSGFIFWLVYSFNFIWGFCLGGKFS